MRRRLRQGIPRAGDIVVAGVEVVVAVDFIWEVLLV